LVELLIDRVLVAHGDVEIRYVIPTHPRGEMTRCCQWRKDYFHNVGEILDLADDDRSAVFLVVALDGRFIGRTPVDGDLLRHAVAADRLRQEPLGGLLVPFLCEEKVEVVSQICDTTLTSYPTRM